MSAPVKLTPQQQKELVLLAIAPREHRRGSVVRVQNGLVAKGLATRTRKGEPFRPDVYEILMSAGCGYINVDCEITDAGRDALVAVLPPAPALGARELAELRSLHGGSSTGKALARAEIQRSLDALRLVNLMPDVGCWIIERGREVLALVTIAERRASGSKAGPAGRARGADS